MNYFKYLLITATLCGSVAIAQDSLHVRALAWLARDGQYWDYRMSQIPVADTVFAVNCAGWGVWLYNAADVRNTAHVSTVNEYAGGIALRGHYLYASGTWFKIFDISDPHTPIQISATPCCGEFMYNVTVAGDYAFNCDETGPAHVYQIADPANPVWMGWIGQDNSCDIEIAGTLAYIATYSGLEIVNISNLQNPYDVGWWWADNASPRDVELDGSYAYLADGEGVPILNISNPAAPTLVHYLNTPGMTFGVDVVSHYLFVAQGQDGLRIYDIANPANPVLVGYYDPAVITMGVVVQGAVAYVADQFTVHLYDVSYFVPSGEPQAPANVTLRYLPSLQATRLDWLPVHLDTENRPVVLNHYTVYLATHLQDNDWTPIGSPTPPDTTFFMDNSGAQTSGFYRVIAVPE